MVYDHHFAWGDRFRIQSVECSPNECRKSGLESNLDRTAQRDRNLDTNPLPTRLGRVLW